jgi:hypothetical protein
MIRSALVLAAVGFATSAEAQDLTITFQSSDGGAATHYYTKDKARFANPQSDTMVDFSTGRIVTIDHKKKEYSAMTIDEMNQMMKAMSAQMEEAMAKVPPQMREQMAKMMGGASAQVEVTKGETKTVAGYACQVYTISAGSMRQETCNTTAITPPFDPANFVKLSRITVPMMQGMDKMVEKMQDVKGIALSQRTSVSAMGRKMDTSLEATEVKKGPIAATTFDLPTGYKQVESPLKKMGPR